MTNDKNSSGILLDSVQSELANGTIHDMATNAKKVYKLKREYSRERQNYYADKGLTALGVIYKLKEENLIFPNYYSPAIDTCQKIINSTAFIDPKHKFFITCEDYDTIHTSTYFEVEIQINHLRDENKTSQKDEFVLEKWCTF